MKKRGWKLALSAAVLALVLSVTACGNKEERTKQNSSTGFVPKLDPQTACSLTVVGHYSNFEALETEFNSFAKYYPNVQLKYLYMDGYSKASSGILSTALAGDEAPDIFFTYPYMGDWQDGAEIAAASENLADPATGIDLSCIRESKRGGER